MNQTQVTGKHGQDLFGALSGHKYSEMVCVAYSERSLCGEHSGAEPGCSFPLETGTIKHFPGPGTLTVGDQPCVMKAFKVGTTVAATASQLMSSKPVARVVIFSHLLGG